MQRLYYVSNHQEMEYAFYEQALSLCTNDSKVEVCFILQFEYGSRSVQGEISKGKYPLSTFLEILKGCVGILEMEFVVHACDSDYPMVFHIYDLTEATIYCCDESRVERIYKLLAKLPCKEIGYIEG